MKNLFNEADKNELVERIEKLTSDSKQLWGKMNAAQMLAHCYKSTQMAMGEINTKRMAFPVNVIGRLLKFKVLGESPLHKNSPTAPEVKVTDERNFQQEKMSLLSSFKRIAEEREKCMKAQIHSFFGKMTSSEWGRIAYKHTDHHLKQFGV